MAAACLASGAWTVAYDDVAPAAVPVVSRVGKAPGASVPASVRAGRSAPAAGRSPLPASSTALSAGTAAAAREWPESANQVAQAVTLERAAVSATPFCAICAERARARGRCCYCCRGRKRAMNDATLDALTHLLWPDGDRLDGPQVHWLLDGARDPQVARLVRFGKLEYACLFSGRLHPRLEAAAPYLVHLAAGSPTTNLLLRRGRAMPGASSRWRRRTSR